ncbi:MAG: GNAT family N-acetyltransferase, partial [Mycobacterium leprae]
TLRPAVPADYPDIVALMNATTSQAPTTLESFTAAEQERATGHTFLRLLAVLPDGTLAGYGITGDDDEQAPRHFYLSIRVAEACRRKGIGRTLLSALSAWAKTEGAVCLEGTTGVNDGAAAFARSMGFVTEGRLFRSELHLEGWAMGLKNLAIAAAEAEGFRFATLAELGATEENLRRLHSAYQELVAQVPGRSPLLPPYEKWRGKLESDPTWDPACVLLLLDGDRWAGLSYMEKQADGSWYSHITGILPGYRGRRLGLALKVAAVEDARVHGVPYLSTYNHVANGAMVAINSQLGYEPVESRVQVNLPL